MKLEHIALTISDPEEVKNFYQDILGMRGIKSFTLKKSLAYNIFGLDEDVLVFLLQRDYFYIEVFIRRGLNNENFNHICIAVSDRETLFQKAKQYDYECIRIERDTYDLIFIKDKSGNIFEVKIDLTTEF